MPVDVRVVDDSVTVHSASSRPLSDSGSSVAIASIATEALERLESQTYDVLLVDVIMPGRNGIHLCRQVRRDKRF